MTRAEEVAALQEAWAAAGLPAEDIASIVAAPGPVPDVAETVRLAVLVPVIRELYAEAFTLDRSDAAGVIELEAHRVSLLNAYRHLRAVGRFPFRWPDRDLPRLTVSSAARRRGLWRLFVPGPA